jgi:hypothetical protein
MGIVACFHAAIRTFVRTKGKHAKSTLFHGKSRPHHHRPIREKQNPHLGDGGAGSFAIRGAGGSTRGARYGLSALNAEA